MTLSLHDICRPNSMLPRTSRAWGARRCQRWRLAPAGVAAKQNWTVMTRRKIRVRMSIRPVLILCSPAFCLAVRSLACRRHRCFFKFMLNHPSILLLSSALAAFLFASLLQSQRRRSQMHACLLTACICHTEGFETSGDYDDEEALPNKLIIMTSKVLLALAGYCT